MNKKEKIILKVLEKHANQHHFRNLKNPFLILIKTILSQRTRDEVTEKATKKLFAKANTPQKILKLNDKKLTELIKPVGFYRQKAKNIKKVCNEILKNNNKVPDKRESLLKLPGVGAKTSDIVLCYAFNKPNIAVDVHVEVVSKRLGLVKKNAKYEEIRKKLEQIFKGKERIINHGFVEFGKNICLTARPRCYMCELDKICPYPDKTHKPKK